MTSGQSVPGKCARRRARRGPIEARRGSDRHRAGLVALVVLGLLAGLAPGTASAASSGTFAPPHADAGLDTNGDGKYNQLRIAASVQVVAGGGFTVRVTLNDDLDLASLTSGSATAALAPGLQRIDVLLNGPDIFNGGVDGPYYAHLTLLSDTGATLTTGVYITSAYGFMDFQPYDARFVPPLSERTADNDTDGLIDWIDLGFTVDVATPGTFTVYSHLTDPTFTVVETVRQTRQLGAGRSVVDQLLPGYPLRIAQRSGPYITSNYLYDARGELIDFTSHQTAAYGYEAFELPPARLRPPHSDAGDDLDGDGRYEGLRVNVGLTIEATGTYTVRGRLFTGTGGLIEETVSRITGVPGSTTLPIVFPSPSIYAAGADGPYRVDLEVYNTALLRLDAGSHSTQAYAYSSFETVALQIQTPFDEAPVDDDGDGRFEALVVTVPLAVSVAGTYRIDAALREGINHVNLTATSQYLALSTGAVSVSVEFLGADILAAGVDGPWRVWVYVYEADGPLVAESSQRTASYRTSDFEAGPTGTIIGIAADSAEDVDGDGRFNRLRVRVQVSVSDPGRYRLEAILTRSGRTIATDASTATLAAGIALVELRFGGPDIRAANLDGPYSVEVAFRRLGSSTLLDSSTLLTSAYQAAAFGLATGVTLRGRVTSASTGAPLAGATVWLLDYADHVSRETVADATGAYALAAYSGTYTAIADHPAAQAKAWSLTVTSDQWSNISLAHTRRVVVEDDLVWAGWGSLLASVRYVFATDGPALRYQYDWTAGNRDGRVQPDEAAGLPEPADRVRELLDAGGTSERLMVNGASYAAADAASWTDGVSGDVNALAFPYRRVTRAFVPAWTLGVPGRVQLVFDTYYDSVTVDRRVRLFVPGTYRFTSSNATNSVLVAARKIPFVADPDVLVPGDGQIAFLDLMLLQQASYVAPRPSPPYGLLASTGDSIVTLSWSRSVWNEDGSRLANLAGYRVYRALGTGAFSRLSGELVLAESLIDHPDPATYRYAVSSVNTDGVEGPLSASVTVSLPSGPPGATSEPAASSLLWGAAEADAPRALFSLLAGCALTVCAVLAALARRRAGPRPDAIRHDSLRVDGRSPRHPHR